MFKSLHKAAYKLVGFYSSLNLGFHCCDIDICQRTRYEKV